jgi:hypothetical protein
MALFGTFDAPKQQIGKVVVRQFAFLDHCFRPKTGASLPKLEQSKA